MSNFVHLHVHTEYSLLDGLSKIPHLVETAKKHGQKALAITDHGGMYGAVKFFNYCRQNDVKPIIGVEAYMAEKSRFDKQVRMGTDQYHLTLLAKNNVGYKNLMKLVSLANLEGFSYKPRMDFELLEEHHEGIIATSGCPSALIPKKLRENKPDEAIAWIKKFLGVFGDDFYMEIQSHPELPELEVLTPRLVELAREYGIPLLATNDVHYVDPEDAEAQDALLAVQMRKTIADKSRLSLLDSPDFYLKSTEEMEEAFGKYPDAIENTVKLADKCNVDIPIGKMIFPNYPLEEGETPQSTLTKMAYDRIKKRYPEITPEIKERLDYELGVIGDKGYSSYFLIVQDFINWAKEQGIGVGPGRGSAAGSLVSYSIGITDVDPLFHNLAFERFLNPQRPSPPDIDVDIADERRDDVIRYVAEKYGEDHVAQVITFGTMEARAAIRDIGRVLGMPYSDPDRIAKLIPQGIKLEEAINTVTELKEAYKDPRFKKLLDLTKKVEGSVRHSSVHAAAVIIADKPLIEYTPIQRETKGGKIITQYDMYVLDLNIQEDAIGLLKMDFLGLRNLSILGRAIDIIQKQTGEVIDLSRIPLDDEKVYRMLSEGETTGVFQLESGGMRRVARSLKPSRFSDLTAMVALYRPGPMELIDDFIAGKADTSLIKYPHDDLKPVLEETYGIPVYQEQVLQIANVFAGYSLGEADILRRAIGKKKKYILDKEKKNFIKGASEKGYTKEKAEEIWGFIEKFAGYGFNKAHSAAYAMIAYQTAYMKANYPVEYMTALLSIESQSHSAMKDEKVSQGIDECHRMGIEVLIPDINKSGISFVIEPHETSLQKKAIRFGLGGIKNVGESALESVTEARKSNQPFTSLTDFCSRIDSRRVNKKVLECLIRAGAFDEFGHRAALLAACDSIREKASTAQKEKESGQTGLFDIMEAGGATKVTDNLPDVPELPKEEKLLDEKNLLGVYLTDHPMAAAFQVIAQYTDLTIGEVNMLLHGNRKIRLGGILASLRQIVTKKGNKEMAFGKLQDKTASIDLVFFPKTYEVLKAKIAVDKPYIIKGKLDQRDDDLCFLVEEMDQLEPGGAVIPRNIVEIPRGTAKEILTQIGQLLKENPGSQRVEIHLPNGESSDPKIMELPYTVDFTDDLRDQIKALLSTEQFNNSTN